MCLITFAWKAHPDYALIVAANRDERHGRPAAPAAWWKDHPQILAGRDLQASGTWMGVTRSGRFAAVTNFRDPGEKKSTARSRGELVTAFLLGDETPAGFLTATRNVADQYNGFNLIVGDVNSLAYFGSFDGAIKTLAPGVYALSNHTLNEPWPKVKQARSALGAALKPNMSVEARRMAIHAFLSNDAVAPDDKLPNTGVGIEWERVLSPALIVTEEYGTRASTILSVANDGMVFLEEHSRATDGTIHHIAKFVFQLHSD